MSLALCKFQRRPAFSAVERSSIRRPADGERSTSQRTRAGMPARTCPPDRAHKRLHPARTRERGGHAHSRYFCSTVTLLIRPVKALFLGR
jgi:hypothetical protein